MSNLSILSTKYFTEVIQRLTTIHAVTHAFLSRSRAARVLASGAVLILLYKLIHGRPKPKRRYVKNLTEAGETGDAEALADYDIIIVGGGTAGCALASRLSENPNIRVLLLESGGSGRALSESRIPCGYTQLFSQKEHVHSFYTDPQASANSKEKLWPRARMLGGCSSINAQMAQYGAPGDFDEWAETIHDHSWAWKDFSRYFRKFEHFHPHPDYPLVDASMRGSEGPVHVGFFNTTTEWCSEFVDSCTAAGIPRTPAGIPRTHDFNAPHGLIGASRIMTYVDKKFERVSSEAAYLTPEVTARPNLTVAIHATVTRILFENKLSLAKPRAVGVEFAETEDGPRYQAKAKKDVILSAGAVQSPHILLLSGIGDSEHLKSKNIPVVVDLPGVGQRLTDHPIVDVYYKTKSDARSTQFLRPVTLKDRFKFMRAMMQYLILGAGGPLVMNFGEAAAFVRTDDPVLFPDSHFPEKLLDTTSAKDSPDLELFITPAGYKDHGRWFFDVDTISLHAYLLRPQSHGSVLLNSANPFAHPRVNPNYISTHDDLAKLVRGMRLCHKIAQQEPISSLLEHECDRPDLDHRLHLKSDAELEEIVRERVETVYHPTSSCRMAPMDQGGVVDSELKVYGVDGLRVCDASIFPSIISGHTAGACFATAEKLADQIKAEFAASF